MSALHYHQREESSKLNMQRRQLRHQGKESTSIIPPQNLVKLTNSCSTIVGVRCKNGIVLGTEKIVVSKMMLSGTDKRVFSITTKAGCVSQMEKV